MSFRVSLILLFCISILPSIATGSILTPLNDDTEFVRQVYRDFLNREADQEGLDYWVAQLSAGSLSRAQVVEQYLLSAEFEGNVAPVARLYFAYFLRIPDYDGLMYWVGTYGQGTSLAAISAAFAASAEFQGTYGSLGNAAFVDLVYQNVLGRTADAGGLAYWTGMLDAGAMSRGEVMIGFSESAEYQARMESAVYVTMTYVGLLRRAPDPGGFAYWTEVMDQGGGGLELIAYFLESAEYKARFATGEEPATEMPSGLTVPVVDPDGVYVVSWGASGTVGASYELEEATEAAFTSGQRTLSTGTARSVSITGRESGKTYYYRVRAVKSGYQDSAWKVAANGCTVKEVTAWQKLVLAQAPDPANIKVRNGNVFWSDSSSQPLKKIAVSGGEATALAANYSVPRDLAVSGQFVYWSDGSIRRTLLDGTLTETLASAEPADPDYPDLIVDTTHLYYVSSSASPPVYKIMQVPVSGDGGTALVTSQWYPIVALAEDAENIYWQENRFPDPDGSSSIRKSSKSGGAVEIVASGLRAFKGGLVIQGNELFFADTNHFDTYRIMKVSASGGAVETLVTVQPSNGDFVHSLAVDDSGIYWITASGVWTAPLTGGSPEFLAATLEAPVDLLLTPQRVIWTEGTPVGQDAGGRIRSISKAGGDASAIVTVHDAPQRLAADGDYIYWTEGGSYGLVEGYGRIAKAPATGGDATTVVMGIQSASPVFALDDGNVYVADKWVIKKVSIGGASVEVLAYGNDRVISIDTDGINVYWVDQFANVFKIPVGGGDISTLNSVFTGGPAGPVRVLDGYVYWMDHYDKIKRVPVDGGDEVTLAPGPLPLLSDFVVDANSAYFSQWDTGWIDKVPIIGGSVTPLVFADFGPSLLTVDNGSLFWVDSFKVGNISVSGGASTILYWNMNVDESRTSFTSDQTNLYWTDAGMGEIVKLTPE